MRRWLWPVGVLVVTGLYGCLPLLGSREVYLRGDSAAQFAPTWWYLGQQLRDGGWPVTLDPSSFAGGNYAAEALFGIWNPLNPLIWLVTSASSDLLVTVTAIKIAIMMALALGTYLLCREYDADRWAAASVATALPFAGFTLWWDAGSWPAGLLAFAYTPWVWWAFRRVLRGTLNPFLGFVVGALGVTQGNPYGTLAVAVVGAALVLEGLVTRNRLGALRLLVTGGLTACLLPLVYLPLVRASALGARAELPTFANNGKMRPELGDLLGLSSPTFVPDIQAITGPTQVPVTYFCWFLIPLLPWLRFGVLRERARELTGLATIGLLYLLMTLGPSNLWLFRWPLRLIEYLYLAVGVGLAIVLAQGLRRDRWRARTAGSAALVAAVSFQAWAQHPTWLASTAAGCLALAGLTALLLVCHRLVRTTPLLLAAVLVAGTGVVLLGQATIYEENQGARVYHVPTDVAALQDRFGDLDGRVMQFADLRPVQRSGNDAKLRKAWRSFLPGTMYRVAGVDAVNSYTGMGFRPFEQRLCLHYEGFTRPCGYRRVWEPLETGGPPLADLLKLETVVAGPQQVVGVTPPANWENVEHGDRTVLVRTDELPWPDSRLSHAAPGVEVYAARSVDVGERLEVTSSTGGELTFAMLAWPGYTATLDGRDLPVEHNDAGLLTVDVPAGAAGSLVLEYERPGALVAHAGAAVAIVGALLLGAAHGVVRRRRRGATPETAPHAATAGSPEGEPAA